MENIRRYQWHVFTLLSVATATALLPRFIAVMPLYLDHDLRNKASTIIQATVAREGWLNSGLTLKHVSDDGAKLLYRSHKQGLDPMQCYYISFTDGTLSSCHHKR